MRRAIGALVVVAAMAVPGCSNPERSEACKVWQELVFAMAASLTGPDKAGHVTGADQALRNAIAIELRTRPEGCPIPGRD
jgi:hypothetical protein